MFPFGFFETSFWMRPYFTDGAYSGVVDFIRAGRSVNVRDLRMGRFCSVTGEWVPRRMLKWAWGRPVNAQIPYEAYTPEMARDLVERMIRMTGGL